MEYLNRKKRVAMISDHASPIAKLGGADSGGQNVYVAHVSTALAKLGFEVDVFTRKTAAELPNVINWKPGIKVFQINAGCRTILIDNGNETEWLSGKLRQPDHIVKDLSAAADIILTGRDI